MKRILSIIALFLMCFLSLQAQKQEKVKPLVFMPQFTAQAQFAGYYVAQEKGFYADEGLHVHIVHPNATQKTVDRIRSNQNCITTIQLSEALQIIDGGIPLVNLLQTSMNNALVIISRRGKDPLKQQGAKVAVWRSGFTQLAECVAKESQLDYEWVPAASGVNLFIAGAVDATLAMSYNEYYRILQAGFDIGEDCVYRFSENGYNIQEDGLYVTRAYYEQHPEQAEKFARASRRGWDYVAAHPEEALDIVMSYVDRNNIATNRILQRFMLEEILRLQEDPDSGEREFRIRPDMLKQANEIMLRAGLLSKPVTLEEIAR